MSPVRSNRVKAFFFKIESVLTNGQSIPDRNGHLSFFLNEKDTFALRMARMHNYPVGLYSDDFSYNEAVFFKRYGIAEKDILIPCSDRAAALKTFASQNDIPLECVLVAISDIPDIECVHSGGVIASPNDAMDEVKSSSDYVSPYSGGNLFVRDIIEQVLKAHGDWTFDPTVYKQSY